MTRVCVCQIIKMSLAITKRDAASNNCSFRYDSITGLGMDWS